MFPIIDRKATGIKLSIVLNWCVKMGCTYGDGLEFLNLQ